MTNQYEVVYKILAEQDKEEIVRLKKINIISMRNNVYDKNALTQFFNFWKIHFPSVKQSMTCSSCRNTVAKFYHGLSDYIENKQKEKKVVTPKQEKKIKTKIKKAKVNG